MNTPKEPTTAHAPADERNRPPVDVAAAQAAAAEVVAEIVRNMIAAGHPPEAGSPLWQFVKRAA